MIGLIAVIISGLLLIGLPVYNLVDSLLTINFEMLSSELAREELTKIRTQLVIQIIGFTVLHLALFCTLWSTTPKSEKNKG